jgi:hypothetical protein
VLLALGIDTESDEEHMLVDVHAIEHQDDHVDRAEVATEPLGHLFLRRGDEPATHGTAALAADDELVGHRLERASVVPSRHANEHLLDGALVQWIVSTERTPAWQLDLAAIERARGRWTCIRRPPSTSSPGANPARYASRPARCAYRGPTSWVRSCSSTAPIAAVPAAITNSRRSARITSASVSCAIGSSSLSFFFLAVFFMAVSPVKRPENPLGGPRAPSTLFGFGLRIAEFRIMAQTGGHDYRFRTCAALIPE